jgi:hypothetical protein
MTAAGGPLLCLLARTPVAGAVKSRLAERYSAAGAALIAAVLIERTVALACDAWRGPVKLLAWPSVEHELLQDIAGRHRIELGRQVAGDLGCKMAAALDAGIGTCGAAAVMGCDVPHCPRSVLAAAADVLLQGKTVLGPAADGGFWLLGASRSLAAVLGPGIEWGGGDVCARVRRRAADAGIAIDHELPSMTDIDRPADLRAAMAADRGLGAEIAARLARAGVSS